MKGLWCVGRSLCCCSIYRRPNCGHACMYVCMEIAGSHESLASPAGFANRLHMAKVNMLSAVMRSTS